jgi:hypothetical protein
MDRKETKKVNERNRSNSRAGLHFSNAFQERHIMAGLDPAINEAGKAIPPRADLRVARPDERARLP